MHERRAKGQPCIGTDPGNDEIWFCIWNGVSVWRWILEAYHADAAEDGVCTDPGKDVAWQTPHCAHDQEKVHHQLDEEDHKDGYVEVGEGETLWDGSPEAVWGEVPEEAGDVEEAVANPDHQAATSQGEAEAAPGMGEEFETWDLVVNESCWRRWKIVLYKVGFANDLLYYFFIWDFWHVLGQNSDLVTNIYGHRVCILWTWTHIISNYFSTTFCVLSIITCHSLFLSFCVVSLNQSLINECKVLSKADIVLLPKNIWFSSVVCAAQQTPSNDHLLVVGLLSFVWSKTWILFKAF